MQHRIDPTVDCVFITLLSAPGNEKLVIHFLNSILRPLSPITEVTVLNPINQPMFIGDKKTVVDVKAKDAEGRLYQIEAQTTIPSYLPKRMTYNWAEIYQSQIEEGEDYTLLLPVISIWLLTHNLYPIPNKYKKDPQSPGINCHWHFQLWDLPQQQRLTEDCSIHVIELAKWHPPKTLQEEDLWLYFFTDAKNWWSLPQHLQQFEVMRLAMDTLEAFSERKKNYQLYQSRLEYQRIQRTEQVLKEQIEAEYKQVKAEYEQLLAKEQQWQQEIQRMTELLRQAGIDPDKH